MPLELTFTDYFIYGGIVLILRVIFYPLTEKYAKSPCLKLYRDIVIPTLKEILFLCPFLKKSRLLLKILHKIFSFRVAFLLLLLRLLPWEKRLRRKRAFGLRRKHNPVAFLKFRLGLRV